MQHRTFAGRVDGQSGYRRSPRTSSAFATRSWLAGWSTCRAAVASSSASTMATRYREVRPRAAHWRSAPASASIFDSRTSSDQEYFAVELRQELAENLGERFPTVTTVVADCQERLPFDDGFFDRVLAIHVLEHLPDLPSALDEVARVLAPGGRFVAVIPCEGGLVYSLARRFTSQRLFEREFGRDYDWFIGYEHINLPWEIESGAREEVSRSGHTLLPVPDPVGQGQPRHRPHDALASLKASTPRRGRGRRERSDAACRRPSSGDPRRATATPPTDPKER